LWDPTIYCGLSFVGNPQAGLFYPPAWLMFVVNLGRPKLPYPALEDLALAHVWLAFVLCYLWLYRTRRLHWLASVLGAGVFAFSGYAVLQLQHLGQLCGYAWMPLGFAAIDQASKLRAINWRPLWKLTLASAMCLLAGYPPAWVVFAVCMLAYGGARRHGFKSAGLVVVALAASGLIAAVQLLPAWEASRGKAPDVKYGAISGRRSFQFYVSYFVPNYFDFSLAVDTSKDPQGQYLYLGAAGLAGLALLAARRRFRDAGPPAAVLLAALAFLSNPFGLLGSAIGRSVWLSQVFTDWYFVAGVSASVALLAALGLDSGLKQARREPPRWWAAAVIVLALAWSARLLVVWSRGGSGFFLGPWSALDTLAALALFTPLVPIFAGAAGRTRTFAALGLLILAAAEYKAFGTSRWFNAARGTMPVAATSGPRSVAGMNSDNYESLRRRPDSRVALDVTGLFPTVLRHAGLSTPQGFDPLLPAQYHALIDPIWHFRTNREFDIAPENEEALRLFGVGAFITAEEAPLYSRLATNPHFRLLPPGDSYYHVFEFLGAQPAFGWEQPGPDRTAAVAAWEAERRSFQVRSNAGGAFRLTEQFFPDWTATIDGTPITIEKCHEAFQCVVLPAGEHRVEFRYRSRTLPIGSAISLLSAVLIAVAVKK
jgi:MYXO-CTERM domain-containing protein